MTTAPPATPFRATLPACLVLFCWRTGTVGLRYCGTAATYPARLPLHLAAPRPAPHRHSRLTRKAAWLTLRWRRRRVRRMTPTGAADHRHLDIARSPRTSVHNAAPYARGLPFGADAPAGVRATTAGYTATACYYLERFPTYAPLRNGGDYYRVRHQIRAAVYTAWQVFLCLPPGVTRIVGRPGGAHRQN